MKNLIAIAVLFLAASFCFNSDTFAQNEYSVFKVVVKGEQCSGVGAYLPVTVYDAGTENIVATGTTDAKGIWFAQGGPQIYHYYDVIVENPNTGQRGDALNVYYPYAGVQVNICLGAPSK